MSVVATRRAALLPRPSRSRATGLRQTTASPAKPRLSWPVALLLVAWAMPFIIYVGPVRMTPYRLTLIFLFIPCIVWLVEGRAGRLRLPDVLVVLFAFWCVLSLVTLHGIATGLQTGGIQVLETVVPYLIARCCIRNADDFLALAKVLTLIALALLPFALYESITGQNLYLDLASRLLPSIDVAEKQPRWNLRRAQLFFEHPILMGVCLGSILALAHIVVGGNDGFGKRWTRSAMVMLTGALSLSSGPLSGILLQILLMGWNWMLRGFRGRWTLLIASIAAMVVVIDVVARRPLPNILFSFAFEQDSAFFRILIWEYGTQSVADHPLFGVGLGEWTRPSWMPPSIDMFWLYNAIVYGLPAGILMLAFFLVAVISIGRVRNLDQRHYDYRLAYLVMMCSFFLTGWMVHFWNGTYVFFMFMVGAGIWLRDAPVAEATATLEAGRQRPVRRR